MAVYTQVSPAEAAGFLTAYALGTLSELVPIVQGIENTNYALTTTTGRYILTLYEKRVQAEDLPFFLGLMDYLARHGIPCPLPVNGSDGFVLRELNNRPATLVTFLDGQMVEQVEPPHCHELGKAMAQMHVVGQGFLAQRPNTLGLSNWAPLFAKSQNRADEVKSGFSNILQAELVFLQQSWPQNLPQGVIHGDMFPDNVFFAGAKLCGLMDFYFACTDYLAYDLSIALNAWCFERDGTFNSLRAQALIKGYESVRPLTKVERDAFPILARGNAMRFILTRLYDWLHQVPDALVKPKNPLDYLNRLQFHQQVTTITTYGFDND